MNGCALQQTVQHQISDRHEGPPKRLRTKQHISCTHRGAPQTNALASWFGSMMPKHFAFTVMFDMMLILSLRIFRQISKYLQISH